MAKLEELMENEEFIAKLEACETEEQGKALFAEYDLPMAGDDEELDEKALESVAGGVIWELVIMAAPFAWKFGRDYGILLVSGRDEKKYGNPYITYSKEQVAKARKRFNL